MLEKRIALIGYSPIDYFQNLGKTLEVAGFEVFWVHNMRSVANNHKKTLSTPSARILDTTENFSAYLRNTETCMKELADLECLGGPRINDIILMDRILRNKSYSFALFYLNHLQKVLSKFYIENSIAIVCSGRDNALHMISMLVCQKLNITWVAPTRARIPVDMYVFASGHETEQILDIRPPTNEDRVWAEEFLQNFLLGHKKPALKAATRSFIDVFKMMPKHAKLFLSLARASFDDYGNNFTRYTIYQIIWMYLRRRFNLIAFKIFPPYSSVGDQPFCLYALHTQPESSIDVAGSYFSDQIALITFISRSLPVSHELYVKIHPTDVDGKSLLFYRKIVRITGVRLINYNVDSMVLVKRASIIFTLTGTIGYEAALMGKNVVTFAKNYFNSMPTVNYCDSPPALPALIDSLLKAIPPVNINEAILTFLVNFKAKSFNGEFNRMFLPSQDQLTTQDLRTFRDAFSALYARMDSPALCR
jgi:hypothetical protein